MRPLMPIESFNEMRRNQCQAFLSWLALLHLLTCLGHAETRIDFNRDVRPILSKHCFFCHGPDSDERKANLRLDTAEGATMDLGGYTAILPGNPAASELMARIKNASPDDLMPPPDSGKQLSEEQITLLERWIQQGAEYQNHWSYVAPSRPPLPEVSRPAWTRNPIDTFILERLDEQGLAPAPEADRVTLARRLYLDLTGMPPTRSQVNEIRSLKDFDREWPEVVRRVTHQPAYGERMAVFWLDLVRFADTVGYHGDQDHSISPYRDYVIKAFNENMPYDQFTREQLAGDLLPEATLWQRIATGYNRLLQTSHEGGVQDKEYLAKYAADRVRNFGLVWMGATTGCAECHNHKYDPYTIEDFYQLAAFFSDLKQQGAYQAANAIPTTRLPEIQAWNLTQFAQWQALDTRLASLSQEADLDPGIAHALSEKKQALKATFAPCMISQAVEPRPMRVLPRGNWLDESGDPVLPGTPGFLPALKASSSPSRLDLANWLFSERHPLTARVMVNRLWKLFFGEGLSRTVEDLGAQGELPSHPELLDWLAVEFEESQWNIQHLIQLMVSSNTYRQSSRIERTMQTQDPANRFLSRQNHFRLQAEFVRDQALQVSGLLAPLLGGRSVKPYQPEGYYQHLNFPTRVYEADKGRHQHRRGLYTHWQRGFLHPMLKAFDAPSREEGTASRTLSNTPLAALTLLNDPSFTEAARSFAQRIQALEKASTEDRIRWAWQETLSRQPTEQEVQALSGLFERERNAFLQAPDMARQWLASSFTPEQTFDDSTFSQQAAWITIARALFNLHETITRY